MERDDSDRRLSLENTSFAKFLRKEGMEEEIEKGEKQKAVKIATTLLHDGFADEAVEKYTGLSLGEVKKVRETLEQSYS